MASVMRSSWVEEEPSDEGPGDASVDREDEAPVEILSMDSSNSDRAEDDEYDDEEEEHEEVVEEEEEVEFNIDDDDNVEEVEEDDDDDDMEDRSEEKENDNESTDGAPEDHPINQNPTDTNGTSNNDRVNVHGADEEDGEEYEQARGLENLKPPLSPLPESDEDEDEYETIEEGDPLANGDFYDDEDGAEYDQQQQRSEEENEGTEHQIDLDDDEEEADKVQDKEEAPEPSANYDYNDKNQSDIEAAGQADERYSNNPPYSDDPRYHHHAVNDTKPYSVPYGQQRGQGDDESNDLYAEEEEEEYDEESRPPGPRNVGPPPNHCDTEDHDPSSPPSPPSSPSSSPFPQTSSTGTTAAAAAAAPQMRQDPSQEQPALDGHNDKNKGNSGSRSGSSRLAWCMCCIILLLLVALGAVLGVFLPRNKGDVDDNDDANKDIPTTETLGLVAVQGFSGEAGSGFGSSVALTGKFLVFGSPTIGGPTKGNTTGIVSTFRIVEDDGVGTDAVVANSTGLDGGGGPVVVDFGDAWKFLEEIEGQEEEGKFGFAVALMSGGGADNAEAASAPRVMVVGAPHVAASGTAIPAGAAFVFQLDPSKGKWIQQGPAIQGGAELFNANEEFGAALASSSTKASNARLVIGAPGNNEAGKGAGRIYIYQRQNPELDWVEMSTTPLLGEAEGARLGSAVDISASTGNVVIAGAPNANSISIYEHNGQEWIRTFLHTATDGVGLFGSSVVLLSDSMVAVGSPSEGSNSGAIHLFQKVDGVWQSGGPTITGEPGDTLGSSQTIDGTMGPLGPELTLGTRSGFVKRFDLVSDSWIQRFDVKTGSTVSTLSISSDNESDLVLVGNKDENKVTLYRENIKPSQQTPPTESNPDDAPDTPPSVEPPVDDDRSDSPIATPEPGADESTSAPTTATEISWRSIFTFDGLPNSAVSLGDSILAVGVPSFSSGVVQTFQRKESEWESLRAIYEDDSADFGQAVSLAEGTTGTYLAVGAPGTLDESSSQASGAVFFYQLDGEALTQLGRTIRPPASSSGNSGKFGATVVAATQMLRVAIGEPESNAATTGARTGRVHIMEFGGVEWAPMGNPVEGSTTGGLYGSAIDMSKDGKRLLVGAPGSVDGEVYYYEWGGSEWNRIFAVPGSESGEALGTAVAILSDDGNMIAMGAPKFGSNNEGVVRVFERKDDGFFSKIGSDIVGSPSEGIGSTLSGSSGRLMVGSASGNFRAFSYDLNSGEWVQPGTTITVTSGITSIATTGDATDVVVGSESDQVFVYNLS